MTESADARKAINTGQLNRAIRGWMSNMDLQKRVNNWQRYGKIRFFSLKEMPTFDINNA